VREGLQGLDDEFINTLKRTDAGEYILGIDYPTYFKVMEQCSVEATRMRSFQLFNNRAYPVNKTILESILSKRKQRAALVGYDSYAAYDIANQMAQNPATVEQFLRNLLMRTVEKEEQELRRIAGNAILQEPLKPWNIAYLKDQYKKEHYALDENKLREYFPMEKTVDGLMRIYEQFFGLRFVRAAKTCLWHDDVYALEVYEQKNNTLLGIFILDLYPRPYKFSHAAHITIVPAVITQQNQCFPEISVVMANFPPSTAETPSLLLRSDVRTFFHEFGHAIHALLGRTRVASYSGTSVKQDFVEMPSQMLEEWLWNPEILRILSSHYRTGEPLSHETISQIVQLKQFDAAMQVRTQGRYALLSLYVHQQEAVDLDALLKTINATYAPHIAWDPDNHFYTSFGHLTGYSAKYYGYLWSKVFALDLFGEIKKTGLLDTATGRRYADMILAPGGSKPPQLLLQAFLGREPRIDAFIKDIGL
jgi:thimet oligopeptidase